VHEARGQQDRGDGGRAGKAGKHHVK
jgi:hypothetical protein